MLYSFNQKAASFPKRLFVSKAGRVAASNLYLTVATAVLAAGFTAAVLPPFMQHEPPPAMLPFMAQASFLALGSALAACMRNIVAIAAINVVVVFI